MWTPQTPFNIKLMHITSQYVKYMIPVTSLDIYDGATNNFNPDGLFSTQIFGKINSDERISRFSYIDIKIPIFHPKYFIELSKLKRLYGEIILGKQYAIWDEELKDFKETSLIEGETGFYFFTKHFHKIEFKRNNSRIRDNRIKFLELYKDTCLSNYVLVIPAGYRDIEVDREGRTKTPEINKLYNSLLSTVNSLGAVNIDEKNTHYYSTAAINLQKKFIDLYEFITSNYAGKNSRMSKKWAARNIVGGTRNVVVAGDTTIYDLADNKTVNINTTHFGFYQYIKMYLPFVIYATVNGFFQEYIEPDGDTITVIDPTTFKQVTIPYKQKLTEEYATEEGIGRVINKFAHEHFRHEPVTIGGYGAALVYQDNKYFKVFKDINELPAYLNIKNVHLLTNIELLYISIIKLDREEYTTNTRYPAINEGSQYDSIAIPRTTINSYNLTELDSTFSPVSDSLKYPYYPSHDPKAGYINAMSVNFSHLGKLSGDFDGDLFSNLVIPMVCINLI